MGRTTVLTLAAAVAAVAAFLVARTPAGPDQPRERDAARPAAAHNNHDMTPRYSKAGHDITPLAPARIEDLARTLSDEQRQVILRKGTEPAFCGNLLDNKKDGVYICRLCGLPLFESAAKFDSGTGWPSFFSPVDPAHVREESDEAFGMIRTEILCARCGGHLGHVFDDAPRTPTGRRYCLNSASLRFFEKGEEMPAESRPVATQTAYFAGGCFWGVEDNFQNTPGVIDAVSGYMGGAADSPTYEQVCTGKTGHAETVRVVFDPARVSYRDLLEAFFRSHDPTQLNRQGPDTGTQYRSAIFAASTGQLEQARAFVDEMSRAGRFKKPIVTRVVGPERGGKFFEAEAYHQDYHLRHGGSCDLPTDPE